MVHRAATSFNTRRKMGGPSVQCWWLCRCDARMTWVIVAEATVKEALVMSTTAKLALLIIGVAGVAVSAALLAAQRADAALTGVSPYSCIALHGGSVTRPAGSTIVVRQAFEEQTLGIERDFLNHQTTLFSLYGAPLADVSGEWSDRTQLGIGLQRPVWSSAFTRNTGITLAAAGDSMTFDFSLTLTSAVPEIFNPAIGGESGQPAFNGPGVVVAGTCTVTAS
jgi:hypothetical protein